LISKIPGGGSLCRIHADELAGSALFFKLHDAIYQGRTKYRLAAAHVLARFPTRAALAGQNIAAKDTLAAKFFEAERCEFESRPFRDEPTPFL